MEIEIPSRLLLESVPDAVLIVDSNGHIVEINEQTERLFGYQRSELLGQSVEVLVPERLRDQHRHHRENYKAAPSLRSMGDRAPLACFRKDGSEFFADISLSPFVMEGNRFVLAYVRDATKRVMTEHRQAAQLAVSIALSEADSLEDAAPRILQGISGSLHWTLATIWLVDREAEVLRYAGHWPPVNPQADAFVAHTRAMTFGPGVGLPGRVWAAREPAWIVDVLKDPNFPRAPLAKEAGLHAAFGFPIMGRTGVLGVIECFSEHTRDPDTTMLQMMADVGLKIGQFIERKLLERHLRETERLAALGSLLDAVSHELNNPLFMISGYTELAGESAKQGKTEAVIGHLDAIRQAAQRASAVLTRLRCISRPTVGFNHACNVNAVLRQTLDAVANELTIRNVSAEVNLAPHLPSITAEPSQLSQVFLALITHAARRMHAAHGRGRLTVTTSLDTSHPSSPWVEIRIADTGPDLPVEHQTRIFEPFFTTGPTGEAKGLSLFTSHRIVTELRGTLSCESRPGHGTTLTVRLPLLGSHTAGPQTSKDASVETSR
jgi:PAS domain S-box-containing protein